MGFRKRETERIERENHAFAKRLFDKQAILSKKKLDEEFKSHLQYKRQIQKLKKKKADKKKQGGEMLADTQQARSKSVDNTREAKAEEEAKAEAEVEAEVEAEQEEGQGRQEEQKNE